MPGVYDTSMIKICEAFYQICDYGNSREWSDKLWLDILTDKSVMKNWYILLNTTPLRINLKCLDILCVTCMFWQMSR